MGAPRNSPRCFEKVSAALFVVNGTTGGLETPTNVTCSRGLEEPADPDYLQSGAGADSF
jgi:hypothetical protein